MGQRQMLEGMLDEALEDRSPPAPELRLQHERDLNLVVPGLEAAPSRELPPNADSPRPKPMVFPDALLADDPLPDLRLTHFAAGERHMATHPRVVHEPGKTGPVNLGEPNELDVRARHRGLIRRMALTWLARQARDLPESGVKEGQRLGPDGRIGVETLASVTVRAKDSMSLCCYAPGCERVVHLGRVARRHDWVQLAVGHVKGDTPSRDVMQSRRVLPGRSARGSITTQVPGHGADSTRVTEEEHVVGPRPLS